MLKTFNLLFFAGFTFGLMAQTTINSPYSSFGFGEKGNLDHAAFTGIGNAAITYFDSTIVNFYNPATYNTLGQGQPLFSLGTTSRLSFLDDRGTTSYQPTAFIEHFAMAFTIKKNFGFAFGLKPYARKGYNIVQRDLVGEDSMKYTYIGSGNTNQFFLGLSSNIINYKKSKVSIGTNLSYLFGSSVDERRSQMIYTNPTLGGVNWQTTRMKSFHYNLGLTYRQVLGTKHQLIIAAVIEPKQKLRAERDDYVFYGVVGNPFNYDTLSRNVDQKGSFTIPTTSSFGVSYAYWFQAQRANNSFRNSEIALHFNYTTSDWNTFSSTFSASSVNLSTSKINVGIQFTPERKIFENAVNSKFLERVKYRVGYYQYTLPYSSEGYQIKDFGTTFGFGIPILAQQSLSSMNFGISLGKRNNGTSNALNENYVGINFGITLAPSNYDRWFRKRKLD